MEYFATVKKYQGNQALIEYKTGTDMREVKRLAPVGSDYEIEIYDGRRRTPAQNRKIHVLIAELSDFTGYPPEEMKIEIKRLYAAKTGQKKNFHTSRMSVSEASQFIDVVLDLCFYLGVSFNKVAWDALSSDYGFQYRCLMDRRCVICGKPAQFCHIEAVGNRSRAKVDHSKLPVMSCCYKHHMEQHQQDGIQTFLRKYHIKPIYLGYDDLIQLGVMTKKRVAYFKEREAELNAFGYFKNQQGDPQAHSPGSGDGTIAR